MDPEKLYCCPDCDGCWETRKSFEVHWTGSHEDPVPCRWCETPIRIRGLKRHEAWCKANSSTRHLVLNAGAVRQRVVDFMARASDLEARPGCVILVPKEGPPLRLRNTELSRMAGEGAYMFACDVVDFAQVREAERIRDRRRGETADLRGRKKPRSGFVLPGMKDEDDGGGPVDG